MIASHHLLLLYPQSCIYIIFNLTKHYTFPTKHETITITNWKNHIILWNEIWYLHSPFHSHFTIHVTPTFRFGMKIKKKLILIPHTLLYSSGAEVARSLNSHSLYIILSHQIVYYNIIPTNLYFFYYFFFVCSLLWYEVAVFCLYKTLLRSFTFVRLYGCTGAFYSVYKIYT